MARSSSRHYCTVCRSWYRTWALHASTAKHMGNVRRAANPAGSTKKIRPVRFRSAASLQAAQDREDAAKVSVTDYYRNPPTPPWPANIRDKFLWVRHHWRDPPYIASRVMRSTPRRRRRGAKR